MPYIVFISRSPTRSPTLAWAGVYIAEASCTFSTTQLVDGYDCNCNFVAVALHFSCCCFWVAINAILFTSTGKASGQFIYH